MGEGVSVLGSAVNTLLCLMSVLTSGELDQGIKHLPWKRGDWSSDPSCPCKCRKVCQCWGSETGSPKQAEIGKFRVQQETVMEENTQCQLQSHTHASTHIHINTHTYMDAYHTHMNSQKQKGLTFHQHGKLPIWFQDFLIISKSI